MVLEALSDSGTVAPLIMTANLHSRANPKSYMYVFSHPKAMQDYSGVSRSRRYNEDRLSRLRRPSTKRDPTWSGKNVARCVNGMRGKDVKRRKGWKRGAGTVWRGWWVKVHFLQRSNSCSFMQRCYSLMRSVAPENGGHFSFAVTLSANLKWEIYFF